ncbi:RNA 2',3'-cyclic phosphodiesterase [Salipiger sp. 1_MG-2023]|uniref:RNA 2',3'-cyclic phosphodiesterase n=1 Tax=Salipiger sp. 1_MG-2023 TaxID=3062665 RepID=UPI0026E120C1|nr:RNA 2',3'-cyclic phosphodiesterase [Salipiger sp. 1_MG-2023]MDO6583968.1 RNA 2',3'-cyclic phosphodiesterase [Salipiger sp. 1_MG-2023]
MRCFLALPVPDALIPPLLAVQEAIPVGRAVPEENLHLTLAFLDEQPDYALAELDAALAPVLPGCALALDGLVSFGGRRVKLLAAGVVPEPGLVALRATVLAAVRAAGIELPRERFRPHITLIRFGAGLRESDRARLEAGVAQVAGLRSAPEPACALRLVGSVLTPGGAIYETLAEWPLG